MRNLYSTPADFWRERDFGTKISAVFEFIGQHWRPLGKCLLYFVLPVSLLLGIGLGLSSNSLYSHFPGFGHRAGSAAPGGPVEIAQQFGNPYAGVNFASIALAFLSGMLSFIMVVGTVFGYLRARLRLPAAETVTPRAVWVELRARLGRMVLVLALLGAAYLGLVLGIVLVVATLAGGGRSGSGVFGVVGVFFLLAFLVLPYLGVVLSLYFPVLWLEDQSVFGTLGRCFQLIKGKWWSTFGLLVVAGILQTVLSVVFAVPRYTILFGQLMQLPALGSEALGIAANTFYAVGIMFTYCIPLLALAFQYFNLAERQEGHGLRLLVDQLGQAAPVAYSSHYQPDEEGEY